MITRSPTVVLGTCTAAKMLPATHATVCDRQRTEQQTMNTHTHYSYVWDPKRWWIHESNGGSTVRGVTA